MLSFSNCMAFDKKIKKKNHNYITKKVTFNLSSLPNWPFQPTEKLRNSSLAVPFRAVRTFMLKPRFCTPFLDKITKQLSSRNFTHAEPSKTVCVLHGPFLKLEGKKTLRDREEQKNWNTNLDRN